ncbi:hypothetical protein [Corallococcus llansteffanensis]|uniref:Uncharacterized protein n=1 Tax=Corallococcus llansteffanensis TaxID=2316731 RepID=A0A3A8PR12_9BACT|nr:hypothetical protein [Corallococcus llansteffanensis]RKH54902.1 hypothetical protein D7V93_24400 [Corallococcus llansteffanensis]
MKHRRTKKTAPEPVGARESGRLHLSLSEATFADFERTFLEHQRAWLRKARTPKAKRVIRRRTAEDILLGAYGRECTWNEFHRALRRTEKLGYDNPGRRAHVACLLALTLKQFPDQTERARRKLDEAERQLRFLRKTHPLRQEGLIEIQRIRRMAGWETLRQG